MHSTRILQNVPKKIKNSKGDSNAASWLSQYRLIIGLEIHAQLNASIKLFSKSKVSNDFSKPNSFVSAFDASVPGTLPILNKEPYWKAIKAAVALNCTVNPSSSFDRKHYFYYDLPQGYQITQQYNPLAHSGAVPFRANIDDTITRDFSVNVQRIQLEQDTGKAYFHSDTATPLVDLNRCGVALIEIVTRPDMQTPSEAVAFVKKLRSILRAIDVCNGNMEEGNLRADVNVNVEGTTDNVTNTVTRTPRVEIKNLNSLKSMTAAINYEYERHAKAIRDGQAHVIHQDTLGWDVQRSQTYKMRSKEDAVDYRYMPDPNLRSVGVTEHQVQEVRNKLETLPDAVRDRLMQEYGLNARDVNVLLMVNEDLSSVGGNSNSNSDSDIVQYFEELARLSQSPQLAVNWVIHELLGQLSQRDVAFSRHVVTVDRMHELLSLIQTNQVTSTAAKKVLGAMLDSDASATATLDQLDLRMLSQDALQDVVQQTVDQLQDESNKAQQGNTKVVRKLIGHAMKLASGKADGSRLEAMLKEKLGLL
ncbi:hypothetical protein E3P99_03480 [Wallemia hederae]|uniref:Glutamyl-tRNA(Gln) amidotransferase subunit B, mitochondrial n=1 Tax=Wallemia hederae TaxID=1540922 RepID=A0A4T0FF98_9BASI|nr:hypothetical protein E3P99_03480 [Wallemia hederae]